MNTNLIMYGNIKRTPHYNKFSYEHILQCVANGMDYNWIFEYCRPVGQPEHIMKDLYYRAVQEIWEARELPKTKIGRNLYV